MDSNQSLILLNGYNSSVQCIESQHLKQNYSIHHSFFISVTEYMQTLKICISLVIKVFSDHIYFANYSKKKQKTRLESRLEI